MFRGLRTVVVVGAVLIVLASVFRYINTQSGVKPASASAAQVTATVDRGDVALTVSATGNIQANQNVPLAFTTSGKVTAINVKAGDYVRQGQTIATIDNQAALDAIASAQVKVATQQLALNKLLEKPRQVDIDVAQAAIDLAQATLAESKIGPTDPVQVQIAQTNVDLAKNQYWQTQLNRDISNQKKEQALANPKTAASAGSISSDTQNNKALSSADYQVQIAQDQLGGTKSGSPNPGSIASAQAQLTSAQAQLQALLAGANADDIKQAQATLEAAQAALIQAQKSLDKPGQTHEHSF
jgi:multidrug efflux pump subunit AcrA (membrane-fusion protein)